MNKIIAIFGVMLSILFAGCYSQNLDDANVDELCSNLNIGSCDLEYCFIRGHPCELHEECFSENTYRQAVEDCERGLK